MLMDWLLGYAVSLEYSENGASATLHSNRPPRAFSCLTHRHSVAPSWVRACPHTHAFTHPCPTIPRTPAVLQLACFVFLKNVPLAYSAHCVHVSTTHPTHTHNLSLSRARTHTHCLHYTSRCVLRTGTGRQRAPRTKARRRCHTGVGSDPKTAVARR